MAEHGGKRTPSRPAAVSGPGSLSRRTDSGPSDPQAHTRLPDAKYGEQANFQEIQAGADLAGKAVPSPTASLVPLGADTQRPDEPVTAGSPFGAGAGPAAAGIEMRSMDEQDAQSVKAQLPMLEYMANMPGSSPSLRAIVRRMKGNL